ncbi:MAG: amidohydrolase [Chloroflexota bacterium]|nr:MAG: amidohydrolase [Chloroflexota bacterium]
MKHKTEDLIALRRDLHAHPELGYQEHRTAALIAERLRAAGLEVTEGVAGTGVVALLRGSARGKTVLVRADMDALPIVEESTQSYRSQNQGVMHACGHDGHVAIAILVAETLAAARAHVRGNVKFVFQPAEESIGGAEPMIQSGVLENPHVDLAVALHLWNELPVGTVGVRAGPIFAGADAFTITLTGRGGHGAMPHQAVDAIAIAGQVLVSIQTLVSREVSPFQPAVVTVGTIQGGTAFNIIAPIVQMQGTIRTFDQSVRDQLVERLTILTSGIAAGMRGQSELSVTMSCPAVVNDADVCEIIRQAAIATIGPENVGDMHPSTGADDMSYFLQHVPGCYFVVGSANPERGLGKPHHHPQFDIDESALWVGAAVLARSTLRLLSG